MESFATLLLLTNKNEPRSLFVQREKSLSLFSKKIVLPTDLGNSQNESNIYEIIDSLRDKVDTKWLIVSYPYISIGSDFVHEMNQIVNDPMFTKDLVEIKVRINFQTDKKVNPVVDEYVLVAVNLKSMKEKGDLKIFKLKNYLHATATNLEDLVNVIIIYSSLFRARTSLSLAPIWYAKKFLFKKLASLKLLKNVDSFIAGVLGSFYYFLKNSSRVRN